MKYYYRQNIARYEKMTRIGVEAWARATYGGTDYSDFSSRQFLDDVVPMIHCRNPRPAALELGTGVGPGAIYLAERGFRVYGVDLIPEVIEQARAIALVRGLDNEYEVMDVTSIPRTGPAYDLIVDSYCLHSIVLDEDRNAVFSAVKTRLAPDGYYLVSSAMYVDHRHHPGEKIADELEGRSFDRYDEDCLFEAGIDLHYEPYISRDDVEDTPASYKDAINVNGQVYVPLRRY
jgi:2-polyprenyl-3-methyl-5-hydroxy-6-metoxy-1,4-benzoquinol methylase